jgi:SAM-dependent methyltransferase
MQPGKYVGTELDIFAEAVNWKRYWAAAIAPYIRGDVLECGAGVGSNTPLLRHLAPHRSWTCTEPDADLCRRLRDRAGCRVIQGVLADLPGAERFDAILYIDVLEHIEDDRGEISSAVRRLNPGGVIVVLAPAHGFLFTPFDRAVGHFRRYNRAAIAACAAPDLELVLCRYLDSAGLLASLGNRLLLRQSAPALAQILFWDRRLVPISRRLDPLLRHRLGKSILAVWHVRNENPRQPLP